MTSAEPFWYSGRDERAEFAVQIFQDYFGDSVLDVGCWKRDLEKELDDGINYTGIDIAGDPDIVVDLEKEALSRFETNEFETIACLDVLEHLDNIHEVFDDLCRVSSNYVLISLPNNYMMRDMKTSLLTGQTVSREFYGLPGEKPDDRHKWMFNYEQAKSFVEYRSNKNSSKVAKVIQYPEDVPFTFSEKVKRILFRTITAPFYGQEGYNNLLVSTLWAVVDTSNR